ncbi:MAG: hypothetical protein ACRCX2_32855 [Paraclostridium sp.]
MFEIGKEYWIYKTSFCDLKYKNPSYARSNEREEIEVCSFIKKVKILKINKRSYTAEANGEKINIKFYSTYCEEDGTYSGYLRYLPDKIESYKVLEDSSKIDGMILEYENFLKIDDYTKVDDNNYKIRHYKREIESIDEKIEDLMLRKKKFETWVEERERDNLKKCERAESAVDFFRKKIKKEQE